MSTPVLEVRGLVIKLPAGADRVLAVEGIDLKIEAGKTLCVVGESGSGKSMIANAVMGLLPRPHVEPVAGSCCSRAKTCCCVTKRACGRCAAAGSA